MPLMITFVYHEKKKFYQGTGTGIYSPGHIQGCGVQGRSVNAPLPPFDYGKILSLDDAKSQEGLILVRLELSDHPDQKPYSHKGKIRVKDAEVSRMKSYFFEQDEDEFSGDLYTYEVNMHEDDREVIVLWLAGATMDTRIFWEAVGSASSGSQIS